ncbi:glycoside hydrolase family 105 protein [Zasmidium cellare ATCC 36951]|uniref:Glycoside hydrolase family 105 protein n=1 Tax=Zasmidium cellare ATCC 36951 TaxID=1080233 RepID=A0A6A6C1J8_ZASCE|nr:glycoside hydrolase family 105 protein [Zasmidium cellare ATCC 36951]KAF2159699.1 glycoside hydrolase family 105 protein [Zasmidium cellare ATCC 36951]
MLDSNIARGDGIENSGASTGFIELGIFQQALRESIAYTNSTTQKKTWEEYLQNSTLSAVASLSNATANAGLPLDRLSIGTSMIHLYESTKDEAYLPAIRALQDSVLQQPRNANGGLWYYQNRNNLTAYHNLSYADGMFSFPPFAILSANHSSADVNSFGAEAALIQLQTLYNICKDSYGLLVHGYDASKDHAWANKETGASPAVWGRALGWYTLGLVNTLSLLSPSHPTFPALKNLYNSLIRAQLTASDRSLAIEGSYGVWQIVDHPGATFGDHANFVEASASCLTAYNLLRGAREGWIEDESVKERAVLAGVGIFQNVIYEFLVENGDGTVGLNGTSTVATLSGDVDFVYYVTRPTVLNSLIGTSAFILASLEVEKIC